LAVPFLHHSTDPKLLEDMKFIAKPAISPIFTPIFPNYIVGIMPSRISLINIYLKIGQPFNDTNVDAVDLQQTTVIVVSNSLH
jgi:hypothetical protein